MKLFSKLFFILFLTNPLLSPVIFADTSKKSETKYLFIQTAKKGELDFNGNKKYTLKLYQPSGWVTYFSNAPKRLTGFISLENYVETHNAHYVQHPEGLNAAIVAFKVNNIKETLRFTMTLKDVKYDKETDTATYTVATLPGNQTNLIPENSKFENVALFIDGDICASCGGSGF